jgi:hypothetical protein
MVRAARIVPPICVLLLLAGALAGCATTQVEAVWSNPEYAGRTVTGKVLVVGLTRDETVRRIYEDAMAARLRGRGVDAARSYDSVNARLAESDSAALLAAAKTVGASRILSTAIVARAHVQRLEVEPGPTWGWTYYGWYGYYWPYGYARTETYEFDRYYASTTLTDVASGKIYWSARTRSDVPGRVENEVDDFVSAVVSRLAADGLI